MAGFWRIWVMPRLRMLLMTGRVRERAIGLYVLGDTVGQDIARLDSAKQFTATLLDVKVEPSSTRGVLVLRNTSGELEQPNRTDRGDSEAGRTMIGRARALIGHRVRVVASRPPGVRRGLRTTAGHRPGPAPAGGRVARGRMACTPPVPGMIRPRGDSP
ncbi:hypothetical protein [Streptomyces sp. NPDC059411]|uniref:hypothetical protein n=1 Tax=Streptomyces sp. NPDC059411 TaxID=3346825 RepID=UPI0036A1CE38